MSTIKDPVCGMGLDPSTAAAMRKHMGDTLYFCSTDCADKFDRDPMQYTAKSRHEGQPEHEGHRHHGH